MPLSIAILQTTSGDDIAANLAMLTPMVEEAAASGAQFIATPENVFYMRREGTVRIADGTMAEHPGVLWAQNLAVRLRIWLHLGSIRALEPGMGKPFNRSVLIAPDGTVSAYYDKIHLFDVTLANGQTYQESAQAVAGDCAVIAPISNDLILGLSICYDLRFPTLYQALAQAGANVMLVPAAFTRPTGEAHWHALLRARAIETASYVIAPAQCGTHPGGRETYGHSLIIDPWGQILAEAADHPQILYATLDGARIQAVRGQIPVLAHRRPIKSACQPGETPL